MSSTLIIFMIMGIPLMLCWVIISILFLIEKRRDRKASKEFYWDDK